MRASRPQVVHPSKGASHMIRDILRIGDPRLLCVAPPATDFDSVRMRQLIADMFDTMAAAQGVGLAAPQIGVDLQVFVYGFEASTRYPDAPAVARSVLCNPVITPCSDRREEGWEGCLSIPGLRGSVPRFTHIHYQGHDAHGRVVEGEAQGFHARVIQHEYDHLIGRLYPSRIENFALFGYTDVLFPEQDIED
ncbi:MAG: peptide deformylase [Burkholderiaceae bacterium]|nr:peptide deformylase [Burkholderiaceae bacterium]